MWPEQLVAKAVSSFSQPGASVVMLPWPNTSRDVQQTLDETGTADLVITSAPTRITASDADDVTLAAAQQLRVGGIFVVLTHCTSSTGELTDPTGQVVTSAQHADLLYLQHIVAVHVPVRDGVFRSDLDKRAADEHHRTTHRAAARGLPVPHLRIHSDVLVFAQPHDHSLTPAQAAVETGVLR